MYRPPQNCNRVKSIKTKFENIENEASLNLSSKNGIRSGINKSPCNSTDNNISKNKLNLRCPGSTSTIKEANLTIELKNENNNVSKNSFKPEFSQLPSKSNGVASKKGCCLDKEQNRQPNSSITVSKPLLDRQLSDPIKRNIKRTPAFRVEKTPEKFPSFERNVYNRNTLFESKVKQFNSVKICDKNVIDKNNVSSTSDTDVECVNRSATTSSSSSPSSYCGLSKNIIPVNETFGRPTLIKSKSSHDFNLIKKKFDSYPKKPAYNSPPHELDGSTENLPTNIDLSLLYTEPIPKALRNKNCEINNISKGSSNIQSIYNTSTLKLTDKKEFLNCLKKTLTDDSSPGLTDSLKYALKKPLPSGPPPQKPPRTFQHSENDDQPLEKNKSFLHVVSKDVEKKITQKPRSFPKTSPAKRSDPKYMLNKLEHALKNNKLRARRQARVDLSTTSGEDSDDSLLFRSKSCRTLPKLPKTNSSLPSSSANLTENLFGDFNCLNAISCTNPAYEKVKEPTSYFFVDDRSCVEPIYAEPYNHLKSFGKERKDSDASSRENRNSLYYMNSEDIHILSSHQSTSLLNGHPGTLKTSSELNVGMNQKEEQKTKFKDLQLVLETGANKQASAENSSLSSFTSDLDQTPSPLVDDPHAKIRYLIEAFDTKKKSLKRQPKNISVYDNLPPQELEAKFEETLYDTATESDNKRKLEQTGKFPVDPIRQCSSSNSSNSSPMTDRTASMINNSEPTYNTNRVDEIQKYLQMTLDRSFSNDNNAENDRDSESEKLENQGKVADIITKFQTYIKAAPKYCQPKVTKDTLFYCCLVVEKVSDCVQMKYKFPPKADVPPDIENLCFPESAKTPPLEKSSGAQECANTYSLLLTNEKGERTFGYCRRVLPEGSSHYLPLAYCILSKYRAPKFYAKILSELESRHGMQNKYRDELISQFYFKKFPEPSESIVIDLTKIEPSLPVYNHKDFDDGLDLSSYVQVNKTNEYGCLNKMKAARASIFVSDCDVKELSSVPTFVAYEGKKTELVITRPPDTRYEDADLKKLHKLSDDILLKVFSSLLLERKMIFISSIMSDLSSCVDSLQSILYPFTWYHTFIPILPESLWDIVESPTPVICGVLSTDAILDRRIENGMVVNLDTNSVLQEEGDETKILCESMKKVWKRSITLANKAIKSKEIVQSVYLADAYLQVFISCLKNYKNFIVDGTFQNEDFLKSEPSKGKRRFLKMFTETCMFHAFVDAAVSNPESLVEFDNKIMMYGSEQSDAILDKLLYWHK